MPIPEVNHLMRIAGGIYVEASALKYGPTYGMSPADIKQFISGQVQILNLIGYSNSAIVDYVNDLSARMVDTKLGKAVAAELVEGKVVIDGVTYA